MENEKLSGFKAFLYSFMILFLIFITLFFSSILSSKKNDKKIKLFKKGVEFVCFTEGGRYHGPSAYAIVTNKTASLSKNRFFVTMNKSKENIDLRTCKPSTELITK